MHPRLAALAVLAFALTACGPDGTDDVPTPSASSSSTPTSGLLTMKGLKTGAPPKIADSQGTLLNGDAAKDVLPADLDHFVATKQLLVIRDVEGNVFAYSPEGPVGTTPIGRATGSLAVNDERNLVAWIAPDGSPTVLQEGEAKPAVLQKQVGVTVGDAVAVLGHDCFNGPETVEGAGCSVYFRSDGADEAKSYVASNHGFVEDLTGGNGLFNLQDADQSGRVGWTKLNADQLTTCSTYFPSDDENGATGKSWQTCDHLPLEFSPDGKHVLATSSIGFEGAGAGEIAVLDRSTGKELWSVSNSPESQVFITDMAWEDDDHILAEVNDGKDAVIIRVSMTGAIERAVRPAPLDENLPNPLPFRLSRQP